MSHKRREKALCFDNQVSEYDDSHRGGNLWAVKAATGKVTGGSVH